MAPAAPITLRTPRLLLRAQAIADFPAYAAFLASPRASGLGGPFDLRAAWGMFCHDQACWHFFGHGALMIEHADTGTCLGQIGINDGPLFPEKELAGCCMPATRGTAMPPRRRRPCATGPSARWAWPRW